MRAELMKIYASRKWMMRVEKMPDKQVYAVYHRMILEDKIRRNKQ